MKKALKQGKPTVVGNCPSSGVPARARDGEPLRCPQEGCQASWEMLDGPAIPSHWFEPYEPKNPRCRQYTYSDGNKIKV